jgi:Na+/H+ antiporter NhaA
VFGRSLEWLVNDGLMVVFFFVVGMEIRREIHEGERPSGAGQLFPPPLRWGE